MLLVEADLWVERDRGEGPYEVEGRVSTQGERECWGRDESK